MRRALGAGALQGAIRIDRNLQCVYSVCGIPIHLQQQNKDFVFKAFRNRYVPSQPLRGARIKPPPGARGPGPAGPGPRPGPDPILDQCWPSWTNVGPRLNQCCQSLPNISFSTRIGRIQVSRPLGDAEKLGFLRPIRPWSQGRPATNQGVNEPKTKLSKIWFLASLPPNLGPAGLGTLMGESGMTLGVFLHPPEVGRP